MSRYIIRRVLAIIPTLWAVHTVTLLIMHTTPGSPWDNAEKPLPAEVVENIKVRYSTSMDRSGSWGSMIAEGVAAIRAHPHLTVVPGLAIAITLLACTSLGDGLRRALDPARH